MVPDVGHADGRGPQEVLAHDLGVEAEGEERQRRLATGTEAHRSAEEALERVMKAMAARYPRPHDHVSEFVLPWDERVPAN